MMMMWWLCYCWRQPLLINVSDTGKTSNGRTQKYEPEENPFPLIITVNIFCSGVFHSHFAIKWSIDIRIFVRLMRVATGNEKRIHQINLSERRAFFNIWYRDELLPLYIREIIIIFCKLANTRHTTPSRLCEFGTWMRGNTITARYWTLNISHALCKR